MARQQHISALEERKTQLANDVHRLATQAKGAQRDITQDAKSSAKNAANDVKGAVQNLKDDAKNIVSTARSDTTDTAKAKVRSAAQAADPRKVIREQPMVALGAGVGIGVLMTLVLLPRRKKYEFQGYPVGSLYAANQGGYRASNQGYGKNPQSYTPTENDLPNDLP